MPAAVKIPEKYKDKKFTVTTYGETYEVVMVETNYSNNGRLRIDLVDASCGEPAATLTMNLVDDDPGEGAFFVKTYSENAQVTRQLIDSGVFVRVPHPRDVVWRFVS